MEKFIKFLKNNVFLIFAAYCFIDFVICLFTSNPIDPTARRFKYHTLTLDLIWTLVFMLKHTVTKVRKALNERIDYTNKRIDLLFDFIEEAAKLMESKEAEKSAEEVE